MAAIERGLAVAGREGNAGAVALLNQHLLLYRQQRPLREP